MVNTQLVHLEVACCTSGLCCRCHAAGNHGDPRKRAWTRWSNKAMERGAAEKIARNWANYSPRIIPADDRLSRENLEAAVRAAIIQHIEHSILAQMPEMYADACPVDLAVQHVLAGALDRSKK